MQGTFMYGQKGVSLNTVQGVSMILSCPVRVEAVWRASFSQDFYLQFFPLVSRILRVHGGRGIGVLGSYQVGTYDVRNDEGVPKLASEF